MANTLDQLLRSGFSVTRGVKAVGKRLESFGDQVPGEGFFRDSAFGILEGGFNEAFSSEGEAAEKSLNSTTVIGTRCAKMPLARRYKSLMNLSKYR